VYEATPSTGSGQGGNWQVKLSGSGYADATMSGFGTATDQAVAGDYDGDGKADPAVYNTVNGTWQVAMSSIGYATQSASGFGGTRYTAPAREDKGRPVASGRSVKICRIVGNQYYVQPTP